MEVTIQKKTLSVMKESDPDFYLMWTYMSELGVNPSILIPIIRAIASISMGTRFGKIQIFIENGQLTMVDGTESAKVNQRVLLDKK